jgi:tRNA threonylcarbamoyladenosine biosynthesis protein TsaE
MSHPSCNEPGAGDAAERLRAGVLSTSAAETEALASGFARLFPENRTLALHGDLGAGKTTFVRGLARAWEINEPVTSPTYNLFTLYSGTRNLLHFDAYRLQSDGDVDALMIEDFLVEPWCLAVEWPERVADWLPADAWRLEFAIEPDQGHRIRLHRPNAG